MLEMWEGDLFIDFIYEGELSSYSEMGKYWFKWCPGYGP